MSLIVEDGSGLTNAQSYLSVADADTYHSNMGNSAWAGTTPQKEAALRKATQYLDVVYDNKWRGYKNDYYQSLSWPRTGAVNNEGFLLPSDELPPVLESATAELALRALTEDILPDADSNAGVRSESVSVGPISTSLTYASPEIGRKLYHVVESLIKSLTQSSSNIVRG